VSLRLALNADTTPLSVSDTLVFKSLRARAQEAAEAGFPAVNVDEEEGLTPDEARRITERLGIEIASGFFHGAFYQPEQEEHIFQAAVRKAEFAHALGQDCLFVSAYVYPRERHLRAGRIEPDEPVALNDLQFVQMARLLERIAELWKEYGISLCYHPHAATYIEAPHEIERLMDTTDPSLILFGPDTGHLFFGGANPGRLIRRYFTRLGAIHLKDVRADVLAQVRAERLDYREACARGVWTELGTGEIDFPALFRFLRENEWSGWVIVETDHTRYPTALESSQVSRKYLKDVIGL